VRARSLRVCLFACVCFLFTYIYSLLQNYKTDPPPAAALSTNSLSSWVFYWLCAKSNFFESQLGWVSLEDNEEVLQEWCLDSPHGLQQAGISVGGVALNTTSPITDVTTYADQNLTSFYYTTGRGSQAVENVVTALAQCVTEQKYIRGAMLRAALYLQVSVSGQALVFVVRCVSHSFTNRAAGLTYAAFLVAQLLATIISVFGFNGYETPPGPLKDCVFCTMSDGSDNPFYSANEVPVAGTEAAYTASVIGSLYYAGAAWIWAAIWYVGLDPIKWCLMAALDEEGVRSRPFFESAFARRGDVVGVQPTFAGGRASMTRASVARTSVQLGGPAAGGVPGLGGRVSVTPAMLARASMVTVRPTAQ
jgi:H+-transporting ATPase